MNICTYDSIRLKRREHTEYIYVYTSAGVLTNENVHQALTPINELYSNDCYYGQ